MPGFVNQNGPNRSEQLRLEEEERQRQREMAIRRQRYARMVALAVATLAQRGNGKALPRQLAQAWRVTTAARLGAPITFGI